MSEVPTLDSSGLRCDSLEAKISLVLSVFQQVWTEFYDWEQSHCKLVLGSLSSELRVERRAIIATPRSDTVSPVSDDFHITPIQIEEDLFTIQEYTSGVETSSTTVSGWTIYAPEMEPSPPYESCAPITRSIFVGDDSDEMPFMPYADDPEFDYLGFIEEFSTFAWQKPFFDPDLEVIVMETARRLHVTHGLSFEHIDETGILPLKMISRAGERGVLFTSRQRDLLTWSGEPAMTGPLLHPPSVPEASNSLARLKSIMADFCTNLNCLVPYCTVHVDSPPIPEQAIHSSNSTSKSNKKAPCGHECYLYKDQPDSEQISWTLEDVENLREALYVIPDMEPCELVVLCRKPCREIFYQRSKLFASTQQRLAQLRNSRAGTLVFADKNPDLFTPNIPCYHEGPCTARFNCPCFLNKAHCTHACRCTARCTRRWSGCKCSMSRKVLRAKAEGTMVKICGDRCSCFLAGRECDPMVCNGCKSSTHPSTVCQNLSIQLGLTKETQVKASEHGLGLFVAERAEKDELIGEYAGELIFEPTTNSREYLSVHRHRNYLFRLNSTLSIDSSSAGNETRYINHVSSEHANCAAKVFLVNGEHRIGIFALRPLISGEEVFLDYGPEFFRAEESEESAEL